MSASAAVGLASAAVAAPSSPVSGSGAGSDPDADALPGLFSDALRDAGRPEDGLRSGGSRHGADRSGRMKDADGPESASMEAMPVAAVVDLGQMPATGLARVGVAAGQGGTAHAVAAPVSPADGGAGGAGGPLTGQASEILAATRPDLSGVPSFPAAGSGAGDTGVLDLVQGVATGTSDTDVAATAIARDGVGTSPVGGPPTASGRSADSQTVGAAPDLAVTPGSEHPSVAPMAPSSPTASSGGTGASDPAQSGTTPGRSALGSSASGAVLPSLPSPSPTAPSPVPSPETGSPSQAGSRKAPVDIGHTAALTGPAVSTSPAARVSPAAQGTPPQPSGILSPGPIGSSVAGPAGMRGLAAMPGESAQGPASETSQDTSAMLSLPTPGLTHAVMPQAAAPATAPAASVPAAFAAQLVPQLAPSVAILAAQGPGLQTLRLRVTPETFGTVTLTVDVGRQGVMVQLQASTASGHDALRQILPQLRDDLGQTVSHGTLTLADPGASGADSGGGTAGHPQQVRGDAVPSDGGRHIRGTRQEASTPIRPVTPGGSVLDVFA